MKGVNISYMYKVCNEVQYGGMGGNVVDGMEDGNRNL